MEISEAIAVNAVEQDQREKCWYCGRQPPPGELKNDEQADPDTSAGELAGGVIPENRLGNDSSKLGKALIAAKFAEPDWKIENPAKPGNQTNVVPAAHHCIPGEASLAQAAGLHVFMRKGGDYQFESDIGYGVNHANNGVWLPGNYAVREDNPEFDFKTWTQYLPAFQQTYVRSAMASASGRMFHDSHRKYNGRVKDTLNSIAAKLTKPVKTNCPICDRPLDDRKNRPPYGLVARLDFVSGEHRNMVVNPTAKTVTAGYFTSSKGGRVVLSPLP